MQSKSTAWKFVSGQSTAKLKLTWTSLIGERMAILNEYARKEVPCTSADDENDGDDEGMSSKKLRARKKLRREKRKNRTKKVKEDYEPPMGNEYLTHAIDGRLVQAMLMCRVDVDRSVSNYQIKSPPPAMSLEAMFKSPPRKARNDNNNHRIRTHNNRHNSNSNNDSSFSNKNSALKPEIRSTRKYVTYSSNKNPLFVTKKKKKKKTKSLSNSKSNVMRGGKEKSGHLKKKKRKKLHSKTIMRLDADEGEEKAQYYDNILHERKFDLILQNYGTLPVSAFDAPLEQQVAFAAVLKKKRWKTLRDIVWPNKGFRFAMVDMYTTFSVHLVSKNINSTFYIYIEYIKSTF
jgi:hypothetical protein